MKTADEFRSFYDRDLLPVLQVLEVERRSLINKGVRNFFLGLIPFVVWLIIPGLGGFSVLLLIAGPILGVGIHLITKYKKISEIQTRFKQEVIAKLIHDIDSTLTYSSRGMISSNDYHRSKLYLDDINKYKGDDLVSGMLGKTAIRFSELCTEKETTTINSKGQAQKKTVTVFRGLFFVADFNKKFIGETVVLPDTAESMFGSLGTMFQKWNMQREQLVKLEDVEFEKAFAVYSSDQVEARYILSTSLMQRILQFKQKTKSRIGMSFIDNQVFIAVPLSENLFEAPFFSSMLNYALIENFNKYLILFIGIVEDLNLNNRIWTKE